MTVQRGPAEGIPRFELNLDRVTISRRSIDSVISCVQKICTEPSVHSTGFRYRQWNFDAAECREHCRQCLQKFCLRPVESFTAWRIWCCHARFEKAFDIVVVHRKDARDTSERWFGVTGVESSVVRESSGQQTVQIANTLDFGEVE